jgi:hypothetical protein
MSFEINIEFFLLKDSTTKLWDSFMIINFLAPIE